MMQLNGNGVPAAMENSLGRSSGRVRGIAPKRFRYSYLYRLIDDSELSELPAEAQAELRNAHKHIYWKNLSLLRRDAGQILKVRRTRMSAEQNWDFGGLLSDYARVQFLLATLTLAGISHSARVPVLLDQVRSACSEFERMLTPIPALAGA
jgi:hypothetical protein